MLCRKPYLLGGTVPFGCGQCLPCRINRRRLWSWRMFLESLTAKDSCFVTLTYSPEKLPTNGSLVPSHVRDWLKRLRHHVSPDTVRFFLVGEYGDQSERPHYHAALFGVGVPHATLIQKTWGFGFVHVAEFNQLTSQYIAGYVVKKMTGPSDPRLRGRHPEFARMSRRPGIGAPGMAIVGEQLFGPAGVAEFQKTGDVPHKLMMGRKSIPLGRYLRRVLREAIGMPDSHVQQLKEAFLLEKSAEVFALRVGSEAPQFYEVHGLKIPKIKGVREALEEANAGRIASVETRSKIFNSRRVL